MAGTGFPRGSPQADFDRRDHRIESQLPGAASNSHWRPGTDRPGAFGKVVGERLRAAGFPATSLSRSLARRGHDRAPVDARFEAAQLMIWAGSIKSAYRFDLEHRPNCGAALEFQPTFPSLFRSLPVTFSAPVTMDSAALPAICTYRVEFERA